MYFSWHKMKIATLTNIILGTIKQYENIEEVFHYDGSFNLSTKDDKNVVYFSSHSPYAYEWFSSLLGLSSNIFKEPLECNGYGASLQLYDEYDYSTSMLYDKKNKFFQVNDTVSRFGFPVSLTSSNGIIVDSNTAVLSENDCKQLMKEYMAVFDKEMWRLRVNEYRKLAEGRAYSLK